MYPYCKSPPTPCSSQLLLLLISLLLLLGERGSAITLPRKARAHARAHTAIGAPVLHPYWCWLTRMRLFDSAFRLPACLRPVDVPRYGEAHTSFMISDNDRAAFAALHSNRGKPVAADSSAALAPTPLQPAVKTTQETPKVKGRGKGKSKGKGKSNICSLL